MRVYFLIAGVVALVTALDDVDSEQRTSNGDARADQNEGVIDKIFNIPITAVKSAATLTQSLVPENKETIDNVFQIPISTLQAVGDLVKSTTSQRRENADDIQRRRQNRRDRLIVQREEQRLRREQILNERLLKKANSRYSGHQKDPWGLNSLANVLIGHHGIPHKPSYLMHPIFGYYQSWFGGGHGSNHGSNHGGHGTHGGSNEEILNAGGSNGSNIYQVHEEVDEGPNQSGGTFFGHFSIKPTKDGIRNKIAPATNDPILSGSRYRYYQPPLENKIAPRSLSRISFAR